MRLQTLEKVVEPMARDYKIKKGLLKGVGLKKRHVRRLRNELKKTAGSYIGDGAVFVVQATAAAVRRGLRAKPRQKALPKREE